ncbi:MAG: OsmC family protein [Gammaproteobacteria bacterium]|nr:OsmC family protein [Gammaproteobacteria bacterium]
MKTTIKWVDKIGFEGATDSGHKIMMDGTEKFGGENRGARPMEMILLGLGGCSSIDVMLMLQKSKQDVTDCVCEVTAERADAIPAVFTKIHVHFVVTGNDLQDNRVKRAVSLSSEKYCSVSLMLEKACEMSHSYEIVSA